MKKIKLNSKYKILSEGTFRSFNGVTKEKVNDKSLINIKFNNGLSFKCTKDHKININGDMIEAQYIKVGENINGLIVFSLEEEMASTEIYDILNVNQTHTFDIKIGKKHINIHNCILVDEIAFVKRADEFYESIYPTITSGDKTKIIFTSTPNGMNFFYKMWMDAENGRSDYIAYDVKWYEHPERGEDWYKTITKNMNKKSVNQEIHCVSGDTNITVNGKKVKIEELYNQYNKVNNTKLNDIVYIQDNIIVNNIKK